MLLKNLAGVTILHVDVAISFAIFVGASGGMTTCAFKTRATKMEFAQSMNQIFNVVVFLVTATMNLVSAVIIAANVASSAADLCARLVVSVMMSVVGVVPLAVVATIMVAANVANVANVVMAVETVVAVA